MICNFCWLRPAAYPNGLCTACDASRHPLDALAGSAPALSAQEADNAFKAAQLRGIRPPEITPSETAAVMACQACRERPIEYENGLCQACDQLRRPRNGAPGSGVPLTAGESAAAQAWARRYRAEPLQARRGGGAWIGWGLALLLVGAVAYWVPFTSLSSSGAATSSVAQVASVCWSGVGSFASALSSSVARACDAYEAGAVVAIAAMVVGGLLTLIGVVRAASA